jgi:3-hydroxybutyryl-CoA dehydrogenase
MFYKDLDAGTRKKIEFLAGQAGQTPGKFLKELVDQYAMVHEMRLPESVSDGCAEEIEKQEINDVAIIGPGTMGRGLAKLFAMKGFRVIVIGRAEEELANLRERMEINLNSMIEKWELTETEKKIILQQIQTTTELARAAEAQLVIETIVEDLGEKRRLMRELDGVIGSRAIVATNTSSFRITDLAEQLCCPERMIGMHFLYPPTKRMVVELVRSVFTSDATYRKAAEVAEKLGKEAVEVYESPGFVTTRVISPFINEAVETLMEGVASAEGIDKAIRLGFNIAMGPLELADTIGLDVVLAHMDYLFRETGDPKFRANALLRRMVRNGFIGRKVGRGFFTYQSPVPLAEEHL